MWFPGAGSVFSCCRRRLSDPQVFSLSATSQAPLLSVTRCFFFLLFPPECSLSQRRLHGSNRPLVQTSGLVIRADVSHPTAATKPAAAECRLCSSRPEGGDVLPSGSPQEPPSITGELWFDVVDQQTVCFRGDAHRTFKTMDRPFRETRRTPTGTSRNLTHE